MNIRKIITIVIVVAALAGAGVFAYMSVKSDVTSELAAQPKENARIILPHGSELNFDTVNKYNQTGRTVQYPTTTAADIGLQLNEIISQ